MTRLCFVAILLAAVLALPAAPAAAQAAREGRLTVTVVDQTGAVIPKATVTVVGVDETTKKRTYEPATTSEKGVATVTGLPPGRYSIQGQFEGFELGLLRDVRVRTGDNKHVVVLPVKGFAEEVTVGRDPQERASDRASAFGTALTREQVESLSDDPEEMRRQLQDLAGPGAAIRVDSFEGQALPPKSQIKAVHITRDMFAAENHMAGGLFIDIITQPGIGPLRGGANFRFYDSALEGRNPLIPRKGPAQSRTVMLNLGGSLIRNKSSFSISVMGDDSFSTPNLYAATLSGRRAETLNVRTGNENLNFAGLFDYAITKDQTIRLSFNRFGSTMRNQGVGAYDLIERAYTVENSGFSMRLQEAGPLGRRFFINTRFSLNWNDSTTRSASDAPTVIVLDSFTGGGAQRKGGTHRRTFSLASDLDYVRGIHSVRTGIQIDGGRYRTDEWANYLGTYTFASLEAYEAGLPRTFTRRIGDPNIAYWNVMAGFYVQDDIRISKTFTISPGVRVEAQTHLPDRQNIGPRFGITYSPFKSGKTTLRGSWGIFYDWLNAGTYEQTLRVDGFRQQELNILDPAYPDPGSLGIVPPTNRYLLGDDLQMARNMRVSAGVDQQLSKILRVGMTYSDVRGKGVLVGQNLNAPVNGVRPDPAMANVIETVSLGESRSRTLTTMVNFNLAGAGPTGPIMAISMGPNNTGKRFSWRRGLMVMTSYTTGQSENNTQGAFSVPASGSLATEWGPSGFDVRHRVYVSLFSTALKNMNASISFSGSSGTPYTITTGRDNNGDSLFNDRPEGVGRGTERAAWTWNSYGNFAYTIGIGKRKTPLPPGITISSTGGGLSVGTAAPQEAPRYRIMLMLNVQNLTNHANYIGYSGVMGGKFFKQPTAVEGVRQIRLSVGFNF